MTLEHLNELSSSDLQAWLFEALHDRVTLPRLTADEAPDVAILAAEHLLDKPTRRDLARACRNLVHDFIRSGEGSLEYVRGLLHLASGLELGDLSGALADLARRFPRLPDLDLRLKQAVLLTIVDLKIHQPAEFWWDIYQQDPGAFAGATLSGLMAQSWQAGLACLLQFPDDEMLAGVAAVIVDQAVEDLSPGQRAECLREIAHIAPRCHPALREALEEVLGEYQAVPTPQHSRLQEAIRQFSTEIAGFLGPPRSPRLVPVPA